MYIIHRFYDFKNEDSSLNYTIIWSDNFYLTYSVSSRLIYSCQISTDLSSSNRSTISIKLKRINK